MDNLEQQLTFADTTCTKVTEILEKADATDESAQKMQKKKWLIIGVAFGLVCLSGGIVSDILHAVFGFLHLDFLSGILADVYLIFAIIYAVAQSRIKLAKLKTDVEARKNEASALREEGNKIYSDAQADLEFLPEEYHYPLATHYLLNAVKTNRADTLREALAMFDEQVHRWNIENAHAEILAEQKAQTAVLRSIRRSNRMNATANTINAFANLSR